jgi:hypothetical protein
MASIPLSAFDKGTKTIGGAINIDVSKPFKDSENYYSLQVTPRGGYFLADSLCVDLEVRFSRSWSSGGNAFHSLGIGIGARYFYKKFYAGAYFNYNGSESYTTFADVEIDEPVYPVTRWMWSKDLTFKMGRLFGISKNVYFDLGVYYNIGLGEIVTKGNSSLNLENERKTFGAIAGIAIFFK